MAGKTDTINPEAEEKIKNFVGSSFDWGDAMAFDTALNGSMMTKGLKQTNPAAYQKLVDFVNKDPEGAVRKGRESLEAAKKQHGDEKGPQKLIKEIVANPEQILKIVGVEDAPAPDAKAAPMSFDSFREELGKKAPTNQAARVLNSRLDSIITAGSTTVGNDLAAESAGHRAKAEKARLDEAFSRNPGLGRDVLAALDKNSSSETAQRVMTDYIVPTLPPSGSTVSGTTATVKAPPESDKQQSSASTAEKSLEAVLKAIGVDADGKPRPGFDDFKKNIEKYPELKSALLSLGTGDKDKAKNFAEALKTELDENPNLFVNVNSFIDKNQTNLGKIAREMVDDPKGAFQKLHTATGLSKVGNWFRENITWGGIGDRLGDLMDGLPGLLDIFKPILEMFGFKGLTTPAADKKPETPAAGTAGNPASTPTPTTPAPAPSAAVLKAQEDAAIKEANARAVEAEVRSAKAAADKAEFEKRQKDAIAQNGSSPSTSGQTGQGPANPTSGTDRLDDTARARRAVYSPDIAEGHGVWRLSSTAQNGGHDVQGKGFLGNNVKLGERGDLSGEWKAVGLSDMNVIVSPTPPTPDNRLQQQQATHKPVQQVSVPT